jgi:hypothetical protein
MGPGIHRPAFGREDVCRHVEVSDDRARRHR